MSPANRKMSARQVAQDVRNGMTHTALMEKYALSFKGVVILLNKMVEAGFLSRNEVDDRLRTVEAEKTGKEKEYSSDQSAEVATEADVLEESSSEGHSNSQGITDSGSSRRRKVGAGLVAFLVFASLIGYLIMPSNRKPSVIDESEDIKRQVVQDGEEIARKDRLLIEAVNKGDPHKVSKLLSQGANAQTQDEKGLTPLIISARNGQSEIVEVLLSKGADINFVTSGGDSALVAASTSGRSELVRLLLEKGANPDAKGPSHQNALTLAVWSGNVDKVAALV